jgi:hypothetical protein
MTEENKIARWVLNHIEFAEKSISEILHNLEDYTGSRIDDVRVDTRNFGQLNVEITLTRNKRR